MIENQHRDDRVIEEYERVEHVVTLKDGVNSEVVSERTERVLPSGTRDHAAADSAKQPAGFT